MRRRAAALAVAAACLAAWCVCASAMAAPHGGTRRFPVPLEPLAGGDHEPSSTTETLERRRLAQDSMSRFLGAALGLGGQGREGPNANATSVGAAGAQVGDDSIAVGEANEDGVFLGEGDTPAGANSTNDDDNEEPKYKYKQFGLKEYMIAVGVMLFLFPVWLCVIRLCIVVNGLRYSTRPAQEQPGQELTAPPDQASEGLSEEHIKELGQFSFHRQSTRNHGMGTYQAMECPVCMDAFAEGDTVRELPCKHRFHMECIDEWLSSHATCPICRADTREALRLIQESKSGAGEDDEGIASEEGGVSFDLSPNPGSPVSPSRGGAGRDVETGMVSGFRWGRAASAREGNPSLDWSQAQDLRAGQRSLSAGHASQESHPAGTSDRAEPPLLSLYQAAMLSVRSRWWLTRSRASRTFHRAGQEQVLSSLSGSRLERARSFLRRQAYVQRQA